MLAATPTKLSLYDFSQILGLNPLHVAGIVMPDQADQPNCAIPWIQFDWQDADRVGREAVARAIATAEAKIEDYLGFRLLPTYEVEERHVPTPPYHPDFVNLNGRRLAGFQNTFRTRWGWVWDYGRRAQTALTIIQQTVGMDPPADLTWAAGGYWQVGTVLADATGITDPEEVRIFYPGHGGDPAWEIRPTDVSLNSGVATIVFRRELAVSEAIWNTLTVVSADPDDDGDFLDTVDVYRVYTDPSAQAAFNWEPIAYCVDCSGTGCNSCQLRTMAGCCVQRGSQKLGFSSFTPGVWNEETGHFAAKDFLTWRQPDSIDISYLAGYEDKRLGQPVRQMARHWREAVAYYAASLLERPPCDCAPDYWEYWREDLSTSNPGSTAMGGRITNVDRKDLINPFGTRRGAIFAWHRVTDGEAIGKDVSER